MKNILKKGMAKKLVNRLKKKQRIRKKISHNIEKPRLTIFRSLKHIYAQVIDDVGGKTIVAASTREKAFTSISGKEAAKAVGAELAKRAIDKKVSEVVFDRNGFMYHGRVQALADSAREAGLKF